MEVQKVEGLIRRYQYLAEGRVDFLKYAFYAITHHSTAIEGSTLTEDQVIDLLEYGKTIPDKPFAHHLMAFDHLRALEFVVDSAAGHDPNNATISVSFLQALAGRVMQNTGGPVNTILGTYDTSKGDIRLSSVRAGSRSFPDAKKVPVLLSSFLLNISKTIQGANGTEQQLKCAFKAHFDLVSIHPFGDGNGRTSRLLMNYIQHLFGLPMSIVFLADRLQYIQALEKSRKEESMETFYEFMFSQYEKFLELAVAELEK